MIIGPCHLHLAEGQAVPAAIATINGTLLCNDCAKAEEPVMDYAAQIIQKFGQHCGLNADWNCRAWNIGNNKWILDDEDGKHFSIVKVKYNKHNEADVIHVYTATAQKIIELLENNTKSA